MTGVDNPSEVWIGERLVAIELAQFLSDLGHQGIAHRWLHQHMVGGDAGLAGVEAFAPGQAPSGDGDVGVVQHDHRTPAPQFQGHRRQLLGGCLHNQAANPAAAGKKNVIKLLFQQLGRGLGAAEHHL